MTNRIPGRMSVALAACAGLAACMAPAPAPSYVLFFTALSSTLSEEASLVVKEASAAAQGARGQVVVAGYVDDAGSPANNIALSLARAQRVADELVQDGVARDRIRLEPKGSAGDPGVVSRRVEIDIVR